MPRHVEPVRIVLDEERDEATIFLSSEQQSVQRGATYLVVVHDKQKPIPDPDSIAVNVAFEDYERLIWIKVSRASKALPEGLLAQAERL